MITILHGDNVVASRKKLEEIASSFSGEVVRFDGKNLDKTALAQALGLNLVVIENFEPEPINSDFNVAIWEGKSVSATYLKNFPSATVLEFKTPATIFKLTDALKSNNGRQLVLLYEECLKDMEAEQIFAMIIRQFRLMLNSDEIKSDWQLAKIKVQTKSFGEEKLKEIYQKLLELDYGSKTGKLIGGFSATLKQELAWI